MNNTEDKNAEPLTPGNILLIAYGCEPNASSEPGVGWNFAREISSFSKVHVITRANNKPSITAAIQKEPQSMQDNISWHYVDIPYLSKLKNKIPLGIQIYYSLWQWKVLFTGRKLARQNKFILCHHLTYGVMWLSPITSFIMKPFLWGPIGGGDVLPWAFRRQLRLPDIFQEVLYSLMSYLIPRVSPLAIIARNRASAIIFRTRSTSKNFPIPEHIKSYVMCETALNLKPIQSSHIPHAPLNIICLGRQTYWKGYIYAIKGFHKYLKMGGQGKLTFLGNGPELATIKDYCKKHNLYSYVSLPGHLPHHEAQEILEKSNILLHPSFRDGGSWAVLEAMEQGKPIICFNRSGLADMVDNTSGILINPITPSQVTDEIGIAIFNLENDNKLFQQLSKGAKNRVNEHYRWHQHKHTIKYIYKNLLSNKPV